MKNIPDRIYLLFTGIAILVFVSCERTADIKYPDLESSLVIHSYTAVGDTFSLALGRSMNMNSPFTDSLTYVKNGWVVLYEDGVFRDSLKYHSLKKLYLSSGVIAQSGHIYKIVAGAPGFQNVEAESRAPSIVTTTNVTRDRNTRTTSGGSLLDDLSFSFQDPAGEKNFYITSLFTAWNGSGFCVYSYDPAVEKYKGDFLPFSPEYCIDNTEILFSDKSFNGALKTITVSTISMNMDSIVDPISGNSIKAYAKRYSVTEEYYKYYKDRITLDLGQGSPGFTDPVLARGNIKRGYGLFTVYAAALDSIP